MDQGKNLTNLSTQGAPESDRSGGSAEVSALGLPELDRVSLRILQCGEATVGVGIRVDLDVDATRAQLIDHRIQIAHPEVDRPDRSRAARCLLVLAELLDIIRSTRPD